MATLSEQMIWLSFLTETTPKQPANIRTGLQTILDSPTASQSLKDYVNAYSGKIAERNGGINGFYGVFDLRANKRFLLFKKRQYVDVSVDAFNVANLLNRNKGTNLSLGNQALYALGIPASGGNAAVPGF